MINLRCKAPLTIPHYTCKYQGLQGMCLASILRGRLLVNDAKIDIFNNLDCITALSTHCYSCMLQGCVSKCLADILRRKLL
jgi:hypothetical protein